MKIAAEPAARYAVGPVGLAALAVSAMFVLRPAPVVPQVECIQANTGPIDESENRVRVGEIVVVGSPDAETIASRIRALRFEQCDWHGHTTLYVHIRDGVVIDDEYKVTCPMAVVARQRYVGDADVMIPIDFGTSTASSP
jgi:hypothetical protein